MLQGAGAGQLLYRTTALQALGEGTPGKILTNVHLLIIYHFKELVLLHIRLWKKTRELN